MKAASVIELCKELEHLDKENSSNFAYDYHVSNLKIKNYLLIFFSNQKMNQVIFKALKIN